MEARKIRKRRRIAAMVLNLRRRYKKSLGLLRIASEIEVNREGDGRRGWFVRCPTSTSGQSVNWPG